MLLIAFVKISEFLNYKTKHVQQSLVFVSILSNKRFSCMLRIVVFLLWMGFGDFVQAQPKRIIKNIFTESQWKLDIHHNVPTKPTRRFPKGFDEEHLKPQVNHLFGGAYVCSEHDLTKIDCLREENPEYVAWNVSFPHTKTWVDWSGIIETSEVRIHDRFLLETNIWPMKHEWGIAKHTEFGVTRHKKVALTISRWGFSYFHFVTESLWRVLRVLSVLRQDYKVYRENNGLNNETYDGLQIMAFDNSFTRHFLQNLMKIPNEQIIWGPKALSWKDLSKAPVLEIDQLVYMSASIMVTPSHVRMNQLRSHFTSIVQSVSEKDTVVYFSRVKEWARNVVQEESILQTLYQRYPFSTIVIVGSVFVENTMTQNHNVHFVNAENITKVIEIVTKSFLIVGAHGAGLTNILWASPKTMVIELIPTTSTTLLYWHLAESLDLDYHGFFLPETHWNSFTLSFDQHMFVNFLDTMVHNFPETKSCAKGYYFCFLKNVCRLCPAGTYSTFSNATDCTKCPLDTWTIFENEWPMPFLDPEKHPQLNQKIGSDSMEDCIDVKKNKVDFRAQKRSLYMYPFSNNSQNAMNNINKENDEKLAKSEKFLNTIVGTSWVLVVVIVAFVVCVGSFIACIFLLAKSWFSRNISHESTNDDIESFKNDVSENVRNDHENVGEMKEPSIYIVEEEPFYVVEKEPHRYISQENSVNLLDNMHRTLCENQAKRRRDRQILLEAKYFIS